jgi:hypothetical protein
MPARLLPSLAMLIALALSLVWTEAADARLERGLSFAGGGVFGSINFDDVLSFDNSLRSNVAQPTYPGDSLGDLFNRGTLIGGFAAGFLGSGVVGLLFGHGVIGELNGVGSVLGVLFQLALIAMLARLIWTWWRDDKVDASAGLSPRQLADAYGRPRHETLLNIEPGSAGDAAQDSDTEGRPRTEQPHS